MELRNLSDITVEEFKRELDRYLTSIPDEPLIPGYTAMRRTDSNSLLDMIPISWDLLYTFIHVYIHIYTRLKHIIYIWYIYSNMFMKQLGPHKHYKLFLWYSKLLQVQYKGRLPIATLGHVPKNPLQLQFLLFCDVWDRFGRIAYIGKSTIIFFSSS